MSFEEYLQRLYPKIQTEVCDKQGKLEIRLSLDGDKYCALIGDDLQSGWAGFGDTPIEALQELLKEISGFHLSDFGF